MKRIISTVISLILALLSFVGIGFNRKPELKKVFDYVYDLGTYTHLDAKAADAYFAKEYDDWGGKCTAVAKTLSDGTVLVGRNMDLNITNKVAYIYRTKRIGCYETINLSYTFRDVSPDKDVLEKEGLTDTFRNLIPFMPDDVLNSKGLYIEINMREGETFEDGTSKFSCSGTNPKSNKRIYMFELPRYVGDHCATVDQALKYIKTLDIYSKDGYWNYAFLLADATGHYGVLEFAQNKVIWHDGQRAQTNFYIDEEMAAIEDYKSGVGRYDTVMQGIDAVNNEEDMLKLMKSVNYFNLYSPETCVFDIRSELVGGELTYDYLMTPEKKDSIYYLMSQTGQYIHSLSRQELQDTGEYWESSFTEVVNCTEKTIFVRFFENDMQTVKLGFDKPSCSSICKYVMSKTSK